MEDDKFDVKKKLIEEINFGWKFLDCTDNPTEK